MVDVNIKRIEEEKLESSEIIELRKEALAHSHKKYVTENGILYVIGRDGKKFELSKRTTFGNVKNGKQSKFKTMFCDTCYLQLRCEGYEKGAICSAQRDFDQFPEFQKSKDKEILLKELHKQIMERKDNLNRAEHYNRKDGGVIDKDVEDLRSKLISDIKMFHELINGPSALTLNVNQGMDMQKLMMEALTEKPEIVNKEKIVNENVNNDKIPIIEEKKENNDKTP